MSPLSFLTIHYIYITACTVLSSIALYLPGGITYIDALLLASGATTQTGLNPIDVNQLRPCQQIVLWAAAMVTNVIFLNSLLVLSRICCFRERFRGVIREAKVALRNGRGCYGTMDEHELGERGQARWMMIKGPGHASSGRYEEEETQRLIPPSLRWHPSIASYAEWNETRKDELGGVEYRALKTLFLLVQGYFITFHLLGALILFFWICFNPDYGEMLKNNGIHKSWWAIFTASSAFNDLGYTLTADSMASFRGADFLLIAMAFLIVMGNTGFPCMLRLVIWVLSKMAPHGSLFQEEVQFLLDHPRRCFTLLFPAADTWRLVGVLFLINAVDLIVFIALDKIRLIDGIFQIASTRTAGFTITSLSNLHPAVQVSFIVMMYISAFPTTIAMRKTNIYEEQSLGIFTEETDPDFDENTPQKPNTLVAHMQNQLGFDLWYVFLGLFLIAIAEGRRVRDDAEISLFPILFEVVSAYGTVGLSMGYHGTEMALCAQFGVMSRLILVGMQVRGRHRGLPYRLDRAVLLPGVCEDRQSDER